MPSVLPRIKAVLSPSVEAKIIVVGMLQTDDTPVFCGLPEELETEYEKAFSCPVVELATSVGASGKKNQITVLPPTPRGQLVVAGLGSADPSDETLRQASGAAVRAIADLPGVENLCVAVSFGVADAGLAIGEGALLGAYKFQDYLTDPNPTPIDSFEIVVSDAAEDADIEMAEVISQAVSLTRDMVNTTANDLYPESFAEIANKLAAETGIDCEVLDVTQLEEAGYGGILAVGSGSVRGPRLIRYDYHPEGATKHLALVGKGITFDSGGLDLKPPASMYTMKSDMAGAASVLAATIAIAKLGIQVRVSAYAACAENMPSGSAYHPSDVLTMYNKKTVENVNTDAEGRLVLADGIARACEDKPDYLVDVATLTGACIMALGNNITGFFTQDQEFASLISDAATEAGEDFWQLPLPADLADGLKSKIADMKSGADRSLGAGALYAAEFLRTFVTDNVVWAHFDIAGPSFNDGNPKHYLSYGATGVPVRTLVTLADFLDES